jgi:hypothetical protein
MDEIFTRFWAFELPESFFWACFLLFDCLTLGTILRATVSTATLASLRIYSVTVAALLVGSPSTSTAVSAAAHFKFFLAT